MKDTIVINGIRCYGRHGADPGEKDHLQAFDICIKISADLSLGEATDRLEDTVNYVAIHEIVVCTVNSTSFNLLERLGGEILKRIFSADLRIDEAHVTIVKPYLLGSATGSVTLARNRRSTLQARTAVDVDGPSLLMPEVSP